MTITEGQTRNSALLALHTRAGEAAGLGIGEVQAGLRTISSVLSLTMPMVYGWLYAMHPSSPWVLSAALAALSQGLFSRLSARELLPIS
jgi:hypothetical protein